MTKQELEAEVKRLRADNAKLLELLGAMRVPPVIVPFQPPTHPAAPKWVPPLIQPPYYNEC